MIKEFFAVFNIRFWLFCLIAFSPLWAGMVAIAVVTVEEKIASYFNYKRRN